MLVVDKKNITIILGSLKLLALEGYYFGLDTETFGLDFEQKMFSLIISTNTEEYYFNFLPYRDGNGATHSMYDPIVKDGLQEIFSQYKATWFIHNAKFDMQKLALSGFRLHGRVVCTIAMERLLYNNYSTGYSLAGCAMRRGLEKDDSVEKYIKEHGLYETVVVKGKNKKIPKYYEVPFDIISKYGCKDARLHRTIGMDQFERLNYK